MKILMVLFSFLSFNLIYVTDASAAILLNLVSRVKPTIVSAVDSDGNAIDTNGITIQYAQVDSNSFLYGPLVISKRNSINNFDLNAPFQHDNFSDEFQESSVITLDTGSNISEYSKNHLDDTPAGPGDSVIDFAEFHFDGFKILSEEQGITVNLSFDHQIEYTYQNDNPEEFGIDGKISFEVSTIESFGEYVYDLSELKPGTNIIKTSLLSSVTQTSDPNLPLSDFLINNDAAFNLFIKDDQLISEPDPVPVPSAIWLLGSGLFLLVKFRPFST